MLLAARKRPALSDELLDQTINFFGRTVFHCFVSLQPLATSVSESRFFSIVLIL